MKTITVRVWMSGFVDNEIEIEDDFIITDDNVDVVLDKYDFGNGNDICDTIEWKLRYADKIDIMDDNGNTLWIDENSEISDELTHDEFWRIY